MSIVGTAGRKDGQEHVGPIRLQWRARRVSRDLCGDVDQKGLEGKLILVDQYVPEDYSGRKEVWPALQKW